MKSPKTRSTTLYRLVPEIKGESHETLFDSLSEHESFRQLTIDPEFIEVDGCPAIFFGVQEPEEVASWCADARITTGLQMDYRSCRSGGLLILGVDGTAYAISYDRGHLLLPDGLRDEGFGLSFLIRSLDASQVNSIIRRQPDAKGRTNAARVAAGTEAWTLALAGTAEIVKRIGGKAKNLEVTFRGTADGKVSVEGGPGLTMRWGVRPKDFVSDIRRVDRVCQNEAPNPALGFVEHIHQVTDPTMKEILNEELDSLLGSRGDVSDRLLPVVPTSLFDHHSWARSVTIDLGGYSRTVPVGEFGLEDLLRCMRNRRSGRRVDTLRAGRVRLNADDDGRDPLGSAMSALKWLEATVSDGADRFFLMDGDWFRIGDDYVRNARAVIEPLFRATPSIPLPAWSVVANRTERSYNEFAASRSLGRLLCLDRESSVQHPLNTSSSRSPLEICDLFGRNGELVHVKRARNSPPLSHLFQQGLEGVQGLLHGPSHVRERFAEAVARRPHGWTLDPGFKPTKLIYAILMENGKTLTPDTLFPFSQAALAHTANVLGTNVDIEVIGIPQA